MAATIVNPRMFRNGNSVLMNTLIDNQPYLYPVKDLYILNDNIHLGTGAGGIGITPYIYQQTGSVAIGGYASQNYQGKYSVSVGYEAAQQYQSDYSVAIGYGAGQNNQGTGGAGSIAIGPNAGTNNQQYQSIAIGRNSGQINQQTNSIALGFNAAQQYQSDFSVAIGYDAGQNNQGTGGAGSIAIGPNAGKNGQQHQSIAIGPNAGQEDQQFQSIAIGLNSGQINQQYQSIAIGRNSGQINQQANSIALGFNAGLQNQGTTANPTAGYAVAIGYESGYFNQGDHTIAIGHQAGYNGQDDFSIVLNATSTSLNTSSTGGLFVKPVNRNENYDDFKMLRYNETSGEIVYSYPIPGVISMYGGTAAPMGHLLCNGTEVSRTTYSRLFDVIGTIYGAGNGTGTFNLPNLEGRVPVGLKATEPVFNALGNVGGTGAHTLTVNEIPAHTHSYENQSNSTSVQTPITGTDVADNVNVNQTTGSTGGGASHNNLQPYIVLNYIISY